MTRSWTSSEIRRLLHQGHIQLAIDLCNLHFPRVLTASKTASSSSSLSSPSSFSSRYSASTATNPMFSQNSRLSRQPSASSLSFAGPNTVSHTFPTFPLHLSLCLQIQLFVEVVRSTSNASSLSRPSTPFSQAQSPSSANGSLDGSTASLASNGTTSSSQMSLGSAVSASTNGSQSAIQVALVHAQNLHAQASLLPDPGMRATYLKELETVSGLLPYHDPRLSPVAYYLDEKRRDALADAVNGAILCLSQTGLLLH